MTPPRRAEDVQAVRRRRVPALRVGPHVPSAEGADVARALAQGRPRRGARRARRAAGLGRRDRVQPRPGAVPRRRDAGGPRAARPRRAGCGRARSEVDAADRPVGLVRRLGRQVRPGGRRASNPVAGPYFNFTVPEPTGVVGVSRPTSRRCSASCPPLAPVLVAGNTVVVGRSRARPLAAVELAEVLATSDVPGGVVNILTGPRAPSSRRGWRATSTSTPSTSPAPTAPAAELERLRRRQRQARRARSRRRPEPGRDHGVPRAQDRLAPGRAVAVPAAAPPDPLRFVTAS